MKEHELRWASLISKGGTTMEAVAKACKEGELVGSVRPVVVISSRDNAEGISRARRLGIPVECIPRKDYQKGILGVDAYGRALGEALNKYNPDVVTMNGFLAMVSDELIAKYEQKIFNQHPGPPEVGGDGMHGKAVHCAVILVGKKLERNPHFTEVIAQRVSPGKYDEGAVVKRTRVEVYQDDTPETLQLRALPLEHQLQIDLLKDVVGGSVKEIYREPFVHPMQYNVLYDAISEAKKRYPNG